MTEIVAATTTPQAEGLRRLELHPAGHGATSDVASRHETKLDGRALTI